MALSLQAKESIRINPNSIIEMELDNVIGLMPFPAQGTTTDSAGEPILTVSGGTDIIDGQYGLQTNSITNDLTNVDETILRKNSPLYGKTTIQSINGIGDHATLYSGKGSSGTHTLPRTIEHIDKAYYFDLVDNEWKSEFVNSANDIKFTTANPVNQLISTTAPRLVDMSLFGIHHHSLTRGGYVPPTIDFKFQRLWDTNLYDPDIPGSLSWHMSLMGNITSSSESSWQSFDKLVDNLIDRNIEPVYCFGTCSPHDIALDIPEYTADGETLTGGMEQWIQGGYGVSSSTNRPTDLAWVNFVTKMVTRFHGKIKYWEIWNEVSSPGFWYGAKYPKGSTARLNALAELARLEEIASVIIKNAHPDNKVISPNFVGDAWDEIKEYYEQGGLINSDIIAYHFYATADEPEYDFEKIHDVDAPTGTNHILRLLPESIQNKPVWNTESGWHLFKANDETVHSGHMPIPIEEQRGFILRYFMYQIASNIETVFQYSWDHDVYGMYSRGDGEIVCPNIVLGWEKTISWLVGTYYIGMINDGGVYIYKYKDEIDDVLSKYIIWTIDYVDEIFEIPEDWRVTKRERMNGTISNQPNTIKLSKEPVKLYGE